MIRNYQLESQAKEVEVEVEAWKEKVVDVNRKRRVFQVSLVFGADCTVEEERRADVAWAASTMVLCRNRRESIYHLWKTGGKT